MLHCVQRAKGRFWVPNLTTDSGGPEIQNFDSAQIHRGLAYGGASHSPSGAPDRNDLSRRCSRPLRPPADLAATCELPLQGHKSVVYRAKSRFQDWYQISLRILGARKSKISIRLRFTEASRMMLLATPPARNDLW